MIPPISTLEVPNNFAIGLWVQKLWLCKAGDWQVSGFFKGVGRSVINGAIPFSC